MTDQSLRARARATLTIAYPDYPHLRKALVAASLDPLCHTPRDRLRKVVSRIDLIDPELAMCLRSLTVGAADHTNQEEAAPVLYPLTRSLLDNAQIRSCLFNVDAHGSSAIDVTADLLWFECEPVDTLSDGQYISIKQDGPDCQVSCHCAGRSGEHPTLWIFSGKQAAAKSVLFSLLVGTADDASKEEAAPDLYPHLWRAVFRVQQNPRRRTLRDRLEEFLNGIGDIDEELGRCLSSLMVGVGTNDDTSEKGATA
jgi:hypothetical protein